MTAPYCPFCQSFRTISTLGHRRRVMCLDCKTRWILDGEDVELLPGSGQWCAAVSLHPSRLGKASSPPGSGPRAPRG